MDIDINNEKREILRVDYNIIGQAKFEKRFFKGEIINFSLNGLLFSSDEVMDVSEGDKLIISINWDNNVQDMMSEIYCIVIRKDRNILGLKFDVIDYDTLMLIKQKLIDITGDNEKVNDEFIKFLVGN